MTITYGLGPMAVALNLYLTIQRTGCDTQEELRKLFEVAEKADRALARDQRDKQNAKPLGRLIEDAERCGIDNWRDLSSYVVEDFIAEAEADDQPQISSFLLIADDEPIGLFATIEDAKNGAEEAQLQGAINIDDEPCQIVEFKAGKPVRRMDVA